MARTPTLTAFILDRLEALKETGADILYLANPFESYRNKVKQIFSKCANINYDPFKNKHSLYSLLHHLQKQGLVEKNKKDTRLFWTITELGRKRLKNIKNNNSMPPKMNYQTNQEKNLKLVIFDIPEKYRRKREWLREQLVMLDFSQLQKSVWSGRNKIPEEFIKNLNDFNLLPYVHILTVKDKGTLNI